MSNKEIKLRAKQALAGNWGLAIAVLFVTGVIEGVATSVGGVGTLVVAGPLAVGAAGIFMRLSNGDIPEFTAMFDGFKNFVNTFIAGLLNSIMVALFTILLIVPGIIKAISYSMYPYLLNDHPDMDGWEALKASEQMMKGHKGELFSLWMSFLPLILGSAVFFPLFFYTAPYMEAATAEYYKRLSAQYIIE